MENLSDNQIMFEIEKIYKRRKETEGLIITSLAKEIGITRTKLFNAIGHRLASRPTMRILRNYWEGLNKESVTCGEGKS